LKQLRFIRKKSIAVTMDVQLYVYDLSRGMARQFSQAFLGIQIDAVYHTSIVFGGVEYFFGAGVQTSLPGRTHHGQPMQKIPLGQTEIPLEDILEYLESLKEIYTAESYDLFMHNCNNFSNDFSMFLVGKNIPDHITTLPQTVLNTPFGQMLKPQLDQALRGVTQAPVAPAPVKMNTNTAKVARDTKPQHPHFKLNLPILQKKHKAYIYTKIPPLDKLLNKLDSTTRDSAAIKELKTFIEGRSASKPTASTPIPDLRTISNYIQNALTTAKPLTLFPLIDLLRVSLIDPRVSGYFAEESTSKSQQALLPVLLDHVSNLELNQETYALYLTTLQALANTFTTPLATHLFDIHSSFQTKLTNLIQTGLLSITYPTLRTTAAYVIYNISTLHHSQILGSSSLSSSSDAPTHQQQHLLLNESTTKTELLVSTLETLTQEITTYTSTSNATNPKDLVKQTTQPNQKVDYGKNKENGKETIHALVLSLGLFQYATAIDEDTSGLIQALDGAAIIERVINEVPGLADLGKEVLKVL
jgi:hypothetical protein